MDQVLGQTLGVEEAGTKKPREGEEAREKA